MSKLFSDIGPATDPDAGPVWTTSSARFVIAIFGRMVTPLCAFSTRRSERISRFLETLKAVSALK